MTIKDIRITARGTQIPVGYNQQTEIWSTDIPIQADDNYIIAEEAVDYVSNMFITITMVAVAMGTIEKIVCIDKDGVAIANMEITAYYRGSDGKDSGIADAQETGTDGVAYLYLQTGNYNLKFSNENYYTHYVNNYQIHSGLTVPYDNTGGSILQSHTLKDNQNRPLVSAFVKVFEVDALPEVGLVANVQTDANGVWAVNTKDIASTQYVFTFEKAGWEGKKFLIGDNA